MWLIVWEITEYLIVDSGLKSFFTSCKMLHSFINP